jgi:hypothetical protein
MIKEKLKNIFSFNGIALIVGILGSLASILTVFVTKWDTKIDLKWFIFSVFIAITIILIITKLLFDLIAELNIKRPNKASVVRYLVQSETFVVSKNDFLGYFAMVSIFFLDDSYEVELGKGYVQNIQDNFIQVKVLEIDSNFANHYQQELKDIIANDIRILQKIVVKSYITYSKQI